MAPRDLPEHTQGRSVAAWRGRLLPLARLGWWAVAILSLASFIAGLPERFAPRSLYSTYVSAPPAVVEEGLGRIGLAPGAYAGFVLALVSFRAAVYYLAGALLYRRQSAGGVAWLVSLLLVAMPSGETDPVLLHSMLGERPVWAGIGLAIEMVAFPPLLWLLFLFPDGRFRPRWTRLVAAYWAAIGFGTLFLPGSPLDLFEWHPSLFAGFFLGCLGAGVYSQVWRYRRISGPVERQQAKWFALGLAAVVGTFTAENVVWAFVPLAWPERSAAQVVLADLAFIAVHNLAFLSFPVMLAIAILRYHLFDIDVIIRRTLIYAVLSGVLAATYLGGVALSQAALRSVTGQQRSQLAVVASTLAVAALFQPMRGRIRTTIDRRFYRRRYDAARTLQDFGSRLRDEVELDALTGGLVDVVEETMRPAHASLWLREPAP